MIHFLHTILRTRNRFVWLLGGSALYYAASSINLLTNVGTAGSQLVENNEGIPQFAAGHDKQQRENVTISAATNASGDATRCKLSSLSAAKNIMILASAPKDEAHATSLWSQLECMTGGIDLIILAVPEWCRNLVEPMAFHARETLGLRIEVQYFINDRYDVGLWCDALQSIITDVGFPECVNGDNFQLRPDTFVVLSNDSVYALLRFSGIIDTLHQANETIDLVGLSYSVKEGFWLESVMRGFRGTALPIFMNHSCVPANHQSFCRTRKQQWVRKRCIVEYHEIAIAKTLYGREKVVGLFPSEPPENPNDKMWLANTKYWEFLVKEKKFPVAKVNQPETIHGPRDVRLQNCTRFIDSNFVQGYNYTEFAPFVHGAR